MSAPADQGASPTVSIVMPCYASGAFVRDALDSIARQTFSDWELVAVDDAGPEDGTLAALQAFADRFGSDRVKIIRHERNLRCSAARNGAMRAGRGRFFALLDPDDFWQPDHLKDAVEAIGDRDICVSRATSVDESGEVIGPFLGDRVPSLEAEFPESMLRENFLLPSSALIRREVIDKIGGFNQGVSITFAPDWDFWLRAVLAGVSFRFTDRANVLYRKHPAAKTSNYLAITAGCIVSLRDNWRRASGRARAVLAESLYLHLVRLAYLKISFRDWSGLRPAGEALRLKPFRGNLWASLYGGLRNNWKDLASSPL